MGSKQKLKSESFNMSDINPRLDYINPRLDRLSKLGLDIYNFLYSEGLSQYSEIYEGTVDKRFYDEEIFKKEIRKLKKSGLICETKNGYVSVDTIISFLLENGPSYYDEISEWLGIPSKRRVDSGLGKFLVTLESSDVISRDKMGMQKPVFSLPYVPEHKKDSKIKAIKHAEELYEALADGELKNARELSVIIDMEPKSVIRLIGKIEGELEWLSSTRIRGKPYQIVYFRNDRISEDTRKDLREIEKEKIEERIKLVVKEPKTVNEVVEETGLSYKTVYTTLKNLEKESSLFSVKVNPKRQASMNPAAWCLKTDDEETDELNKFKASFKSASQKYGVAIFEHLHNNLVSTRRKMAKGIDIDVGHLDSVLKTLKKYGLVDNEPFLYWYNTKFVNISRLCYHLELDYMTIRDFTNRLVLQKPTKEGERRMTEYDLYLSLERELSHDEIEQKYEKIKRERRRHMKFANSMFHEICEWMSLSLSPSAHSELGVADDGMLYMKLIGD